MHNSHLHVLYIHVHTSNKPVHLRKSKGVDDGNNIEGKGSQSKLQRQTAKKKHTATIIEYGKFSITTNWLHWKNEWVILILN